MEIIESLRKQITELEKQLNIEKDQNQNLLKELQDFKDKIKLIQDLENKLEEEKNKNKILKDKHEKQKKRIYKNIKGLLKGYDIKQEAIQKIISKLTGQNKDLIKVNFISTDQQINCSLECNKKDKFSKIENLLYEKYPQYKESENDFISNDITLYKEKTLEDIVKIGLYISRHPSTSTLSVPRRRTLTAVVSTLRCPQRGASSSAA